VLAELAYARSWIGHRISRVEAETGSRVALLTRLGEGMLPHAASVLQEGDLLHVTALGDRLGQVAAVLSAAPQAGDY
jgi:trk system potassium uptake protein TrkA